MTTNCTKCNSNRVISVNAKCSDMCGIESNNSSTDGYVPRDLGIGGGDYIDFSYCLECGQLQGNFPLPTADIEKDITDDQIAGFFTDYFVEGSTALLSKSEYFDQRNVINSAKEVSENLGSFIRSYFEYNVGRHPSRKHPPVERFVQMFRTQDYDLSYEY
jgi:hypothetical protein